MTQDSLLNNIQFVAPQLMLITRKVFDFSSSIQSRVANCEWWTRCVFRQRGRGIGTQHTLVVKYIDVTTGGNSVHKFRFKTERDITDEACSNLFLKKHAAQSSNWVLIHFSVKCIYRTLYRVFLGLSQILFQNGRTGSKKTGINVYLRYNATQ